MSANHVPMHATGCARCARRQVRLDRYVARMAERASPKGEKAALKAEIARMRRAHAYQVAPADPVNGRPHRHEPGRRQRMKAQREHHQHQLAAVGVLRALAKHGPSELRRRHAYCDGLGHKWSGWKQSAGDRYPWRSCERGSCRAVEEQKPIKKQARKAA